MENMSNQTTSSSPSNVWGPQSISYWLVAIISLGLLTLGINGFIQPEAAIHSFGIPIYHHLDVAIVRIKADRDLITGLVAGVFLVLRMKKALIVYMLVATGMPIIDAFLVLTNQAADKINAWPHLVTIIYVLFVCVVLNREERLTR
jgi:hypothetical protein